MVFEIVQVAEDIESLNQRAVNGELEVTAISVHAYAYVAQHYALMPCGASIGDRYGPLVVSKEPMQREDLAGKKIAIPGEMTTAYLTLRLCQPDFEPEVVQFDQILPYVQEGNADAGLIIHEGTANLQTAQGCIKWLIWGNGGMRRPDCPYHLGRMPSVAISDQKRFAALPHSLSRAFSIH